MLDISLGIGLAVFLLGLCLLPVHSVHKETSQISLSVPPQDSDKDS
jgi:hypothetical protein